MVPPTSTLSAFYGDFTLPIIQPQPENGSFYIFTGHAGLWSTAMCPLFLRNETGTLLYSRSREMGNVADPHLNRDSCGSVRIGDRALWACRDTQATDDSGNTSSVPYGPPPLLGPTST